MTEQFLLTPVAKVRRNHKEILGVGQVGTKDLAKLPLLVVLDGAHQHGYNGEASLLALHDLGHIGQVHLYAVLVLIYSLLHCDKLAGGMQFRINLKKKKKERQQ